MPLAFTMVMTMAVIVLIVIIVMMTMMIMILIAIITVARHDYLVIPALLYEIHGTTTGIILIAMFFPVFGMTWRHHQIQWRTLYGDTLNNSGFAIQQLGLLLKTPQIKLPVKPRLTKLQGNPDICGLSTGTTKCRDA